MPLAARSLGLSDELVEKDFWVTEILRVLQQPPQGIHVIFKGGTSLSKGFQLIKRMSEDVDILLEGGGLSNSQRESALREITEAVSAHLRIIPSEVRSEQSRKLTSRFSYGAREMKIGSQGVLLELGFRGHPEPSQTIEMTSYLSQYVATREDRTGINYRELDGVRLDLLAPERTLLEKIFALHVAASSFEKNGPNDLVRMARYYYDIRMLLGNTEVCAAVSRLGDMSAYSENELRQAGIGPPFPGAARPAGGFAESPAFRPPDEIRTVLAPAYGDAMAFVFLDAEKPTLAECLASVEANAGIL